MAETHHPGTNQADKQVIYDTVRPLIDQLAGPVLDALAEKAASPNLTAFAAIWRRLDPLPGAQALTQELGRGGLICNLAFFIGDEPLQTVEVAWRFANNLMQLCNVTGYRPKAEFGSAESDQFFKSLLPVLRHGSPTTVIEHLTTYSPSAIERDHITATLPMTMLHIAATASYDIAAAQVDAAHPELDSEACTALADDIAKQHLRAMCASIQQGNKPKLKTGSPAKQAAAGAFEILRRNYRYAESQDAKLKLYFDLLPLYIPRIVRAARRGEDARTILASSDVPPAMLQLVQDLSVLDIRFEDTTAHLAKGPYREIYEAITGHVTDPETSLEYIRHLHAQLRARQYARDIIDSIASGALDYIDIMQVGYNMLTDLTEHAAARREKAERLAAQQVADEARRRETVILESLGEVHSLGWQPLPVGVGTAGPRTNPAPRQSTGGEAIKEKDDYRIAVLKDLQKSWPGSKIYHRSLRKPKVAQQPDGNEGENPQQDADQEEYYVLVLPRIVMLNGQETVVFDALAECRETNNGLYFWRAETGMVEIDGRVEVVYAWDEVFKFNRPHARKMGAQMLIHPSAEQRAEDPELAAGMFRDLILEPLTETLTPGQSPTLRRRSIGRGTLAAIRERQNKA